jgi:hypothetical protein
MYRMSRLGSYTVPRRVGTGMSDAWLSWMRMPDSAPWRVGSAVSWAVRLKVPTVPKVAVKVCVP